MIPIACKRSVYLEACASALLLILLITCNCFPCNCLPFLLPTEHQVWLEHMSHFYVAFNQEHILVNELPGYKPHDPLAIAGEVSDGAAAFRDASTGDDSVDPLDVDAAKAAAAAAAMVGKGGVPLSAGDFIK